MLWIECCVKGRRAGGKERCARKGKGMFYLCPFTPKFLRKRYYNALLEACAPNSSEQNARAAMNLQCERFGTAANVQCQMRVFERMSDGVGCDARVGQQIRECTGISAAVGGPACRYQCNEICRRIGN